MKKLGGIDLEAILLEYAWVLVVLIVLEGLLAADNAVVMAVMVKHLPRDQQTKSTFLRIIRSVCLPFCSIVHDYIPCEYLANSSTWGSLSVIHFHSRALLISEKVKDSHPDAKKRKKSGFWMTVVKVELADIAFALDSMLAAVALAVTLPELGNFHIGGINGGQFIVMLLGGIIGLVIMRFAARQFVVLLQKFPSLETAAFLIVGWVGVKLAVLTLAHPGLGILDESFPHSTLWQATFWIVLVGIALNGYLAGVRNNKKESII